MENELTHIAKLRWQCRRGMLELDVLLGNFLQHHYGQLPLPEKEVFVQLLACSDQDLFAWLMGNEKAQDGKLQRMVQQVRDAALNSQPPACPE